MQAQIDLAGLADAELASLMRQGDVNGPWEELYRRYYDRAVGLAHAVVRHVWPRPEDEAADVAQEVLAHFPRTVTQFDREEFWPWLARVVRNKAIDRLRKQRQRRKDRVKVVPLGRRGDCLRDPNETPADRLIHEETLRLASERLREAAHMLHAGEYRLLYRYHVVRHSTPRLAADLGRAEPTIRQRLSRAKRKLLAYLGGVRLTNRELGHLLASVGPPIALHRTGQQE
jgi:RNA polymerase sigma factor (sigma-70 family)